MRQAGIIAAPGIIALEEMIDRLKDDHKNARRLAEGISKIEGIQIDLNRVQTNMVCFDVDDLGLSAETFVMILKENGILALPLAEKKVRMVTHRGIESKDIEKSIEVIENVIDHLN